MENPIKMDDLGVPLFLETSIYFCGSTTQQKKAEVQRNCQSLHQVTFGP